ncbi:MAG: hypothetical protein J0L86_04845 [Flavobacteriales bacterium]|nr:hypothetical protein [Flavobacteriales bacterium]
MYFNYEDIQNRKFVQSLKIEELDLSNIDNLVLKGIYIEEQPSKYQIPFKSEGVFKDEDSTEIGAYIHLNSKDYHLNEIIQKEIYTSIRFFVECADTDTTLDLSKISANLEGRIEKTDKIKYLHKKHKDLYSLVNNEPEFLVYCGIKEFNGYNNWEEYIYDNLYCDSELIIKYLTTDFEKKDIFQPVFEIWKRYYVIKTQIDFCKEQLNIIQGNSYKPETIDSSYQVFLIEEILRIDNWDDLSATKKGVILSCLLGKNKDNLKKVYIEIGKKISLNSDKLLSDRKKAEETIKKLLG